MLLLVLVLVLIAFGLLVVALLTGSVLWAWVSVGISVAAAAVLLVDWLQRRSAVKAGSDAGDVVPTPAAEPVPPPHDPGRDPVTEVIPVVPPGGAYGGGMPEAPVGGRGDERPDNRETVEMRPFAPSGSAGGPSGALDGIGASGPNSSHSVTSGGVEHGGSAYPGGAVDARETDGHGDGRGAAPDPGTDSETIKVAGPVAHGGGRDEPPHGHDGPGGPLQTGVPMHADLPPLGPDGAPPEEPHDADAAGLVAELNDEVLVVDELPRYHLGGCRSLVGVAVIPLPAREAVELGFTPCAWCTPDRTLSGRYRAPAR